MKIEKINYQKAFPIGPFLQEKIGIEIEIDNSPGSGETAEAALDLAKMIVEDWHKANNPHMEEYTPSRNPIQEMGPGPTLGVQPATRIDEQEQYRIDQEFAKAQDDLSKIEFQEDALKWMNNNGWTYNVELKKIANNKPKKQ